MHDAPLEAHEHTEHVMHEHDAFVSRVAILVAVLAVLAAGAGNLEALETTKALAAGNEATLQQDLATDAWAEYQADSIKRHLYTVAQDLDPAAAARFGAVAKDQRDRQDTVRARAEEAEKERTLLIAESKQAEARHHWLTGAATLLEIAIAMSTVSLVTRKHWLLAGGGLLGAGGVVLLAMAYVAAA